MTVPPLCLLHWLLGQWDRPLAEWLACWTCDLGVWSLNAIQTTSALPRKRKHTLCWKYRKTKQKHKFRFGDAAVHSISLQIKNGGGDIGDAKFAL